RDLFTGECHGSSSLLRRRARSLAFARASGRHGAALDALFVAPALEDAVHEDARGVHVIGIDGADVDDLFDLRDGDAARGRHHRIEVHRGVAIDEVAVAIALPRFHDREFAGDAGLEDVVAAVELPDLFLLRELLHRAIG